MLAEKEEIALYVRLLRDGYTASQSLRIIEDLRDVLKGENNGSGKEKETDSERTRT